MKTFLPFKSMILAMVCLLTVAQVKAQTYSTQAAGNWNAPSTWVGGVVPATTISAGGVVNINHAVVYDLNNDLNISGVLNISGDTLRFPTGFNKNIKVISGGLLKVINGGLLQPTLTTSSDMDVDMGTVVIQNSKVIVSHNFDAIKGSKRTIKNSTLIIGKDYDLDGSSSYPSIDSIQFSIVETNTTSSGEFHVRSDATLRVANAYIKVNNNSHFKNESGGTISTLPGANSNFGFDYLKVSNDLVNDATWNARIDAACITDEIKGSQMSEIDFTRSQDCSTTPQIGAAPELIFSNPVLFSGTANQQGAVYRFSNVMPGVDARIKLKKFSRPDIVMQSIDLNSLGWDKAFQPQFGLAGNAPANQNWYIDFEIKFYEAGTNTIKVLPKVDMTALDVDGDGVSIKEYASFQNPSNVMYSTVSSLTEQPANNQGQLFLCPVDGLSSVLIACPVCGGDGKTGIWNLTDCTMCTETGLLHTACSHPFEGVNANLVNGPVTNYTNIDTAATQVMATYQYTDRSVINFRYGAKSGTSTSNAGIRLNSLWFRQFNLAPVIPITLPVKLSSFTATLSTTNRADLKWITASEMNVSHFVIERSTDGSTFSDAAMVFAMGNTTDQTQYSFSDNLANSTSTVFYYRLRSVDIDGKVQYSEIRVIRIGKGKETISILAYPNPVKNELRITIPAAWQNKTVSYELFNANGQVVRRIQTASSSQTETIDMISLAPGFYVVKASCGTASSQQRVIKQ